MSESEETYCRLCAETTPTEHLISTEDKVAVNSKIVTKLLRIDIDISNSNTLPNTICFHCFDRLEETYIFLHNVRIAQHKLNTIFLNKFNQDFVDYSIENKIVENVKPVDKNWESFQGTKNEVEDENQIGTVPESSKCNVNFVKQEIHYDDNTPLGEYNVNNAEGFNTTNSDLQLHAEVLELEETALHTVRTAEHKLFNIFSIESNHNIIDHTTENKDIITENLVKPEACESSQVTRNEVEIGHESSSINNPYLFSCNVNVVNQEICSENDTPLGECIDTEGFNITDSHIPFSLPRKKMKSKRKKKKEDLEQSELKGSTWDDYICQCVECSVQCKNISSLRQHSLQIHSCCCIFKCSDCSLVVPNYIPFVNHVRSHRRKLKYCCEFCNRTFDKSASLKKHLTLVHRDAYLTMCPNCGLNFDTPEKLQDHTLIYSKIHKKHNVKQQRVQMDLKCEHCNKEFKALGHLKQHKLIHTKRSRAFACDICGKSFFTKGILGTHMLTHGNTKPYKCEFCSKAFRTKGNLQTHISLHSRQNLFVCKQCDKHFDDISLFESHSIVHTDLMPYVCEYCNKTFHLKTSLVIHLRQHKKLYTRYKVY